MDASLKTWSRFIAFVAANGLALVCVYLLVIEPALGLLTRQRDEIEQRTRVLEQVRSVIARNRMIASIDPSQIEAAAQRFLQGDSESLLSADLLRRLRQAAEEQGMALSSVSLLPPREWFDRRLVGARIEFSGPTKNVANVLSSIEHSPSLFFINNAKLSQARSPEGAAADDAVSAVIEVYGVTRWQET
jgi:hypothetical protein